jgi:hypothetical protein
MLTACGGGNSSGSVIDVKPTPTPTPTPVAQTLNEKVDSLVATSETASDAQEPDSIDANNVSEPDDSEPKAL